MRYFFCYLKANIKKNLCQAHAFKCLKPNKKKLWLVYIYIIKTIFFQQT